MYFDLGFFHALCCKLNLDFIRQIVYGRSPFSLALPLVGPLADCASVCGWARLVLQVLPFAGGEYLVLKEKLSTHDLQLALATAEAALNKIRTDEMSSSSDDAAKQWIRPTFIFRCATLLLGKPTCRK
jgi:hypothetical protein